MNNVLKEVLSEIAEVIPVLKPEETPPERDLPVDDPAFPNDLEPVIRADDIVTSSEVHQDSESGAATPAGSGNGA